MGDVAADRVFRLEIALSCRTAADVGSIATLRQLRVTLARATQVRAHAR